MFLKLNVVTLFDPAGKFDVSSTSTHLTNVYIYTFPTFAVVYSVEAGLIGCSMILEAVVVVTITRSLVYES